MPHPRVVRFGRKLYIEARIYPPKRLRFVTGRFKKPVIWVCLGVGIASVTVGISLLNGHTRRHTKNDKGPPK